MMSASIPPRKCLQTPYQEGKVHFDVVIIQGKGPPLDPGARWGQEEGVIVDVVSAQQCHRRRQCHFLPAVYLNTERFFGKWKRFRLPISCSRRGGLVGWGWSFGAKFPTQLLSMLLDGGPGNLSQVLAKKLSVKDRIQIVALKAQHLTVMATLGRSLTSSSIRKSESPIFSRRR